MAVLMGTLAGVVRVEMNRLQPGPLGPENIEADAVAHEGDLVRREPQGRDRRCECSRIRLRNADDSGIDNSDNLGRRSWPYLADLQPLESLLHSAVRVADDPQREVQLSKRPQASNRLSDDLTPQVSRRIVPKITQDFKRAASVGLSNAQGLDVTLKIPMLLIAPVQPVVHGGDAFRVRAQKICNFDSDSDFAKSRGDRLSMRHQEDPSNIEQDGSEAHRVMVPVVADKRKITRRRAIYSFDFLSSGV